MIKIIQDSFLRFIWSLRHFFVVGTRWGLLFFKGGDLYITNIVDTTIKRLIVVSTLIIKFYWALRCTYYLFKTTKGTTWVYPTRIFCFKMDYSFIWKLSNYLKQDCINDSLDIHTYIGIGMHIRKMMATRKLSCC